MSETDTTAPLLQDQPQKRKPRNEATEQVTYLPGPEDPPSVKWAGHVFHANVPKAVNVESHATLLESARKNRFFKVGAFDPAKDRVPVEETKAPKTPEQYRAHCVAWLNKTESDSAFLERWISEEKLREECGVGTDDLDFLNDLITPKRAEWRKRGLA